MILLSLKAGFEDEWVAVHSLSAELCALLLGMFAYSLRKDCRLLDSLERQPARLRYSNHEQ